MKKIHLLFLSVSLLLFSCKSKEDKISEDTQKVLEKYTFLFGPDNQWRAHYLNFSGKIATYTMTQIDVY